MECNCDCHKKTAESDLKKCRENSNRKSKEINALKKKLVIATIAIAVGGTLVGKESLDKMIEYFQYYDKVKQSIDGIGHNSGDTIDIPMPAYYGISPSPSTMVVFAIAALLPVARRT